MNPAVSSEQHFVPPAPSHRPAPARFARLAAGLTVAALLPLAGLVSAPGATASPGSPPAPAARAAAASAPTSGLVAAYDFSTATGNTIANQAAGSPAGAATIENPQSGQFKDGALVFSGGAKGSTTGNWVRLPDNLLTTSKSATITTEVKIDASMKNANHFLWNIGNDATDQYLFANTKDAPRTAITTGSGGGEKNARATTSFDAGRWYSLTSVVDGDAGTLSLFVDGVKVGSTATSLTPASITDQSLNTIGRAPWPDTMFKGAVSTFRVYDRALSADEIQDVNLADASLHSASFESAAQSVVDSLGSQLLLSDSPTVLPSAGGAVTWTSTDPAFTIKNDGVTLAATQPEAGSAALTSTLTATATVRGVSASAEVKVSLQPKSAATDDYGYLMVHFIEDSEGYAEKIYLDISRGDNPEQWDPLNAGKPILASDLGTTGLRDPFITKNPETGTYYIIATDLRVFGGDSGSGACTQWCHWSTNGSTKFMVWESQDLVSWGEARELNVTNNAAGTQAVRAGMAWAPEATWVPNFDGKGNGSFVLYWSSSLLNEANTYSRILWGSTPDFTQATYSYGGVFVDAGGNTIDTTLIQDEGTTYRITKDNAQGKGIYMESTDSPTWWEAGTIWRTLQTKMGASWAGGNAGGVEGPAVFKRHDSERWYLYVDVIPTTGYRPMTTTDLSAGFTVLQSPTFYMAPSTKHGGIVSLTAAEYQRLRGADAVSVTQEDLGTVQVDASATATAAPAAKAARAASPLLDAALPDSAEVVTAYGRGTSELPIDWDTGAVDLQTSGTYPVTGTVRSLGANLNDWVGAGGSTAYDAPGKVLRSTTALTVRASLVVTAAETAPPTETGSATAPAPTTGASTPSEGPSASATDDTAGPAPVDTAGPGTGAEDNAGPSAAAPSTSAGATPAPSLSNTGFATLGWVGAGLALALAGALILTRRCRA
ncbi:LamG-like jellyroll fold domain-containing protein [Galactobacter valiniphilus]|uniref:LamG-like jellyroll fold domain-containing protein n=1 Tax=Galactobacter valiniphilus TaxID=2676122 RepID=UPI003734D5D4